MATKKLRIKDIGLSPVTLARSVVMGDGTTKNLITKLQEIEESIGTAGDGTTEHWKGSIANYSSIFPSSVTYVPQFESGIYYIPANTYVDNSSVYAFLGVAEQEYPLKTLDSVLIVQRNYANDLKLATWTAYAIANPNNQWKRSVLQASGSNDGRATKWFYCGMQEHLTDIASKKCLMLGDSLWAPYASKANEFTGDIATDLVPIQPEYSTNFGKGQDSCCYRIKQRIPLDIWSLACPGARYTDRGTNNPVSQWNFSMFGFYNIATNFDFFGYDVLLLGFGTNDAGNAATIGATDSTDSMTLCGTINIGMDAIYDSNPDIVPLVVLPPPRMDQGETFAANIEFQKPYNDAIATMMTKWGAAVYDSLTLSGITQWNWSKYLRTDKLHYKDFSLWGNRVAAWVDSQI